MANRTLQRMPQGTHHREGNYKAKKSAAPSLRIYVDMVFEYVIKIRTVLLVSVRTL